MQRVALDTSVLIPLLQGKNQSDIDRQRKSRTQALLNDPEVQPVVPAPALAEFLAFHSFTDPERQDIINKISPTFDIVALDTAVLVKAGSILARIPSQAGDKRQCLKVDALIVACAVAGKCDSILSTDSDLSDIAGGLIPVNEPPEIAVEQDLDFE